MIELWTGIPESKVKEKELQRVAHLEDALKKKIIGQDEAIALVAAGGKALQGTDLPSAASRLLYLCGPYGGGKNRTGKGAGSGAL